MSKKNPLFPGKYDIFESNSPVVAEIFKNNFDYTWHYPYFINGSDRKEWPLIPGENSKDDGSVIYKYNSEYFRCDEFKSDHDGLHILFGGCSETEGQGGNLEDSWSKILFDEIVETNKVDGYYSIGKSGFGWQKIISQTKVYISKYGKPDIMFVLLPNIGRFLDWSDSINDWFYRQQYPRFGDNLILDRSKDEINNPYVPTEQSPQEYKKMFVEFATSWRLFEDFCNEANINLIWAAWEPIDNYNFSKFNIFKNFVPIDKEEILNNIEKYRPNLKIGKYDLEKRDGHHGRIFHEVWASKMLDAAKLKGFLND